MANASKKNLKALERALTRAAELSLRHADAVQAAEKAFEKAFGEEVPEEAFSGFVSSKEEVGSLFNNFVNYSENMSEAGTEEGLVLRMQELMNEEDE